MEPFKVLLVAPMLLSPVPATLPLFLISEVFTNCVGDELISIVAATGVDVIGAVETVGCDFSLMETVVVVFAPTVVDL